MKPLCLLALAALIPGAAFAQRNLSGANTFVRLEWENDVLQLRRGDIRDENFTNGLRLDLMGDAWKLPLVHRLLLEFPTDGAHANDYLYTLSVGQDIYTPNELSRRDVIRQARPYAGWLYASSGLIVADQVKARKLTSSLSLGVMGPASGSDRVQTAIHDWFNFETPMGWHNQIKNAVGISYAVRYEARPFQTIPLHRSFDVLGLVEGHVGTVTNYVGAGGMLRMGQFNDYFQNATGLFDAYAPRSHPDYEQLYQNSERLAPTRQRRKQQANQAYQRQTPANQHFQLYAFMRPVLRTVLDNSFLQGGWLTRNNPHTIKAEEVERFYVNVEYGGVLAYKKVQVAYVQSFRTREIRTGPTQQWGKVCLLVGFR